MPIASDNYIEYCAEIAQSHDGSLGYVLSIIDSLAERDVDTVKFQLHLPEYESTKSEDFRIPMSGQDNSRFEYWDRTSFKKSEWLTIKQKCEDLSINFLCTPFSPQAIEILEEIGTQRYKIASADLANIQLLDEILKTNKPIILSTGMSNFGEVQECVDYLGDSLEILLHCVSQYPLDENNVGFTRMSNFISLYPNLKIGYSDHTGKARVANWAIALGAKFIEQHVVFSREQYGPDSSSSIELDAIPQVIEFKKFGFSGSKFEADSELPLSNKAIKTLFGRGIAPVRDIKKGEAIALADITMKKPTGPLSWQDRNLVVGKVASVDLSRYQHLSLEQLEEDSE